MSVHEEFQILEAITDVTECVCVCVLRQMGEILDAE